jgi:hypothetical protein
MKKHLQVSFALGNGQEVWIQHPDLSAAIPANERGTGCFGHVMEVADGLAHHLGLEFEDDIEMELSEIHNGKLAYEVELWDYNDGATMIRSINLKDLETTE